MSRTRKYCFTINNYTEEDVSVFDDEKFQSQITYFIIGKEVGEKGTPHIQGFIIFKNTKTFNQFKKWIPRCHVEPCKGSIQSNYDYCSKDGDFLEFGIRPEEEPGKRNDLIAIKEAVLRGAAPSEIVVEHVSNYQQLRYMEGLMKYVKMPYDTVKDVYWLHGPTGSGKTREAMDMAQEIGKDVWISGRNLKWWDGYMGQETVIIDEFRADFCTFHELLRILDRYAYRVEFKGGSTWLMAKTIIITSNVSPTQMFKHRVPEDIGQLLRRIKCVKHIGPPETIEPEFSEDD